LDLDNRLRTTEAALKLALLTLELRHPSRKRIRRLRSSPSLTRAEFPKSTPTALSTPGAQVRRVQAFTAKKGTHLARLLTSIGLLDNLELARQ